MKRLEIDFEGRTVLITGAATGIGRATALAFAASRAAVLIGDVDPRAEDTVREIIANGGQGFISEDRRFRQRSSEGAGCAGGF
jgi:NAD(P)-dependent dehydrogenase (short-subunit alcohol dehydrogenase family)